MAAYDNSNLITNNINMALSNNNNSSSRNDLSSGSGALDLMTRSENCCIYDAAPGPGCCRSGSSIAPGSSCGNINFTTDTNNNNHFKLDNNHYNNIIEEKKTIKLNNNLFGVSEKEQRDGGTTKEKDFCDYDNSSGTDLVQVNKNKEKICKICFLPSLTTTATTATSTTTTLCTATTTTKFQLPTTTTN